jgi:hypothetical protein
MNVAGAPLGVRRHLEGWQMGLAVVLATVLSALLVVPRQVEPEMLPPPRIDRGEQQTYLRLEQQRSARGRAGLPLEVRAVGEAFRRFGRASFEGSAAAAQIGSQLQRLARVAVERHGSERLLELRGLQTELFVDALNAGLGDEPGSELRELGGNLLKAGRHRGWFAPSPWAADDHELNTLFRVFWAEALGLSQAHPYAPTLNEWRVYYRFLLSQPTAEGIERDGDLRRKLGYVAALAQHDQTYPVHLARGVLLYQRGAHAESAGEFRAHLELQPAGPWALRARNYLAACGAVLSE